MSISNDQPISAGNLKAALDGLTGGGSLIKSKVLYRGMAMQDTYQLDGDANSYDILITCINDNHPMTNGPQTAPVIANMVGRTDSLNIYTDDTFNYYINVDGSTVTRGGGDGCPYPTLIVGMNF